MFDKNKLDRIKKVVKSDEFSGVVSIRTQKNTILKLANGYLDIPNKLSNQLDTRFAIASGTKMFTALGVMRLIEEKKLRLDDKLLTFFPNQFPTYSEKITIKHLLTHTSGIPDYYDEEQIKEYGDLKLDIPWYDLKKPSDYLAVMPQKEMQFMPGEQFSYNNSAFVFLAIIIEKLTGNYFSWVEQEVLNKADMSSSGFFMLDNLPKNCANGYIKNSQSQWTTNIYKMPIIAGGDGGLYTTEEDLFKFWIALFKGRIVNESTLNLVVFPHYKSENMSYGLGVWLENKNNQFIPVLFGEDPGISFESGYDKSKDQVHSILSNTTDGAWKISKLLL
jgi:CubicO group peptidase (beta-lactamase class C family)